MRACGASIMSLGRTVASRTDGPMRACGASIMSLGRTVASHTEGVRAQAFVAFMLSFALAMIVGTMVLSHGARRHGTAPKLVPEPAASSAAVAPGADVVPWLPALVLPRIDQPSKRAEEAVRVFNAAPVGQPQATSVAVRPSGSVRSEVVRVTEIALWGKPTKPWVSITASGPVRYQLRNVEPDWVVIDVSKAELALGSGGPPAGRGLVRLIRVGQFTPDVVRVVLELTEAVPVHVATSPSRNAIVVSLAVDARGNSHTAPAPGQRPGAVRPVPMARFAPPGT